MSRPLRILITKGGTVWVGGVDKHKQASKQRMRGWIGWMPRQPFPSFLFPRFNNFIVYYIRLGFPAQQRGRRRGIREEDRAHSPVLTLKLMF